jgi:hypothetical protein
MLAGSSRKLNYHGFSVPGAVEGAAKSFFSTEAGQRLLLEAAQYPAGSKELQALISRIPALASQAVAQPDNQKLKELLGANNASQGQ